MSNRNRGAIPRHRKPQVSLAMLFIQGLAGANPAAVFGIYIIILCMWYVYVIQHDTSKRIYIGKTNDIRRRLKEHNSGKSNFTKKRR